MLHLHRPFWREQYLVAVNRRTKCHAFLAKFAHLGQRKDLEPTRVRKNGSGPVHEFVQSTMVPNDVRAGTQHQVKCVSKNDFSSAVTHLIRRDALYGTVCTDRHKSRRMNIASPTLK